MIAISMVRLFLGAVAWEILVGPDSASWVIGAPVIVVAVGLSFASGNRRSSALSLIGVGRFIPYFLWQSLRAGVLVVRAAFGNPRRLRPILQAYSTRLPEGPPRALFAGTVSLLAGTLAADLVGKQLLIHVLDAPLLDLDAIERLEQHIGRVFALDLEAVISEDKPHG